MTFTWIRHPVSNSTFNHLAFWCLERPTNFMSQEKYPVGRPLSITMVPAPTYGTHAYELTVKFDDEPKAGSVIVRTTPYRFARQPEPPSS